MTMQEVADEISRRMVSLFLPDAEGRRPCPGDECRYAQYPHCRDLVLFHEHFCGETGRGLGASQQTGWTALVATRSTTATAGRPPCCDGWATHRQTRP